YVGNVHLQVTEALLQEVFQSTGPVEGCKLIRKEKVSFLSYFHTYASNSCSIKLKLKYDLHLSFLGFAIAIPCDYAGLANPLKLIGRMPVGKERTRQVQFQIISCTKILFQCIYGSHRLLDDLLFCITGHYNIFVGDLSPEVTDATLFACFSVYPSCS
ncbi:hypothetical protein BHM03_00028872, partial [Ensete ventricosum]